MESGESMRMEMMKVDCHVFEELHCVRVCVCVCVCLKERVLPSTHSNITLFTEAQGQQPL